MATLNNIPDVKLAIVGVSRDCFPIDLTRRRLAAVAKACRDARVKVHACKTIIESENDVFSALVEATDAHANAAVIYLGNFGPEGPLSIFAETFGGPVMVCAAAEESADSLVDGRGDAFCGMLNASYNLNLRGVPVHIPEVPVGLPDHVAGEIAHFRTVAGMLLGLAGLKVFAFGPRPQDFYACNAPIAGLYDLGVEVMENSELDMLQLYQAVDAGDAEVKRVARSMARELGAGNNYPDLLPKLARFEVALTRFREANLGSRSFAVFANKCWPAFEGAFGFVPCYVNSRLAGSGYPVACEVDMYGAVSEYLCQLAAGEPATLLDVNNTVPADLLAEGQDLKGAGAGDLFMGFHCGNTASSCMKSCEMKYQLIMHRLMEGPDAPPDITRGTLEGQIKPGPVTLFRLQGAAEGGLSAYVAEGNVLDVDPRSFGSAGVLAVPGFARFYRHILIARHFPHHAAVAFGGCGRALFDAMRVLGIDDVGVPLPAGMLYAGENPFC
jgi:L-fucose isomerase-like protein